MKGQTYLPAIPMESAKFFIYFHKGIRCLYIYSVILPDRSVALRGLPHYFILSSIINFCLLKKSIEIFSNKMQGARNNFAGYGGYTGGYGEGSRGGRDEIDSRRPGVENRNMEEHSNRFGRGVGRGLSINGGNVQFNGLGRQNDESTGNEPGTENAGGSRWDDVRNCWCCDQVGHNSRQCDCIRCELKRAALEETRRQRREHARKMGALMNL